MNKQDGYASRTAADLERKYNFGQTFAEFFNLVSDARKTAEEAKEAFDGLDQEAIFNLLTNYGKAQGIYRDEAGNVYVNASFIQSGTLADDMVPASIARTSDIPKLVSDLSNDSGYLTETGVTTIVKGVVTTDYVNALGITVSAAQISDVLVIGKQLPADLAVKGDIPQAISDLRNDLGFVTESGVTTIVGGVVTTDYVNALGISVDAAKITGTLTVEQLPGTVALSSEIPQAISELRNDLGYVTESGVTTIVGGIVTADYVNALGITVTAANISGKLTIGQLPTSVAETSDIPSYVSDLYNDMGYQTETGVVTIIDGTVDADYIEALEITACELTSIGVESFETVSIYDGYIDFYSGYIMDVDYGHLEMHATTMITFSTSGAFRFLLGSGKYWVLDGSGMYFYDENDDYINHFELAD